MSARRVVVRALARSDIAARYRWLVEEADRDIADRFLEATDRAFWHLAEQPGIGSALAARNPRLAGLRKWKVQGFPGVLIFYEPRPHGVAIVRVLHAAQDWWALVEAPR